MGSRVSRVAFSLGLRVAGCGLFDDEGAPAADDSLPLPERGAADGGGVKDGSSSTDARPPPSDAGSDAEMDAGARFYAFASSTTGPGAMGGFAGADARCAALASDAGLSGSYTAWLSGNPSGPHAINRLTGTGPWHLVTGELVAADKTELASGTLRHAIDRDEKGAGLGATTTVWTGTGPDGRYLTNDCDIWTPSGQNGRFGDATKSSAEWTSSGVGGCGGARRVYCFGR